MAKLVPFQPPPGVWANGTAYEAKGRWNDSNLVRWKNGRLQPLGGWEKAIGATLSGVGRAMLAWKDYSGTQWLAIGTNEKLYVFTSLSGSAEDITPVIASPNSFITGNSDAELGLGFGAGDFSGTETIQEVKSDSTNTSGGASGQISIDRETDKILTTKATSAKIFTDGVTNTNAPGIGPAPFGVGDEIELIGFSGTNNAKTYPNSHRIVSLTASEMVLGSTNGSAAYGGSTLTDETPSGQVTIRRTRRYGNENSDSSSLVLAAASWIFDLWGEDLVGMSTADGRLYQWDVSLSDPTSTVAALISGAPTNNKAMLVSKENHMFALGANGNNRLIKWSDADDNTTWGATSLNQAGSFHIDTNGEVMAGKTVGDQILVWTTNDLHSISWVGPPYIYGRKKIGDSCGAISNRSMVAVGDKAFWMGSGGFWQYQGTVQPLQCDVQDKVFSELNSVQISKIYASVNAEFFEVSWWYADVDSTEILKYCTYNWAEGWWSVGTLSRTAWEDAGVFESPIAINAENTIYQHEQSASTSARTTSTIPSSTSEVSDIDRKLVSGGDSDDLGLAFAQTGAMEVGDGEKVTNISQLIADSTQGANGLRFKFKTAYTPNGTESTSSNYDVTDDGYVDVREQGRQFKYRVESGWDQSWDIGTIRASISTGGKR